jgi:hypothetical protein
MVDLPDFGTPLRRIAGSVEKLAGDPPGDDVTLMAEHSAAHAAAANNEVQSHA